MTQFKVVPTITSLDTWAQFVQAFAVGGRDLLITDRIIYDTYLHGTAVGCVIIQDDFGAGEPDEDKILAILQKAAAASYDRVIAVGGGSVMDIGKLLAIRDFGGDLLPLFRKEITPCKEKKLLILPTTCGTGSEVTNISVSAFPKLNTKIGLADDALYADDAVLISELISTLPFSVFMHSSIDALIHAIESYLSPKASTLSRMFSADAIIQIVEGYRYILQNGQDSRSALLGTFLTASNNAGIAFSNAGCGLIHAMSYPIGGTYHLPHGASNYEVMIAALRFYVARPVDGRFDELLRLTGPLDQLQNLIESLSPRKPMREYGMTEKEAIAFAKDVEKNQQRLLANCYVKASVEDMAQIYREIL